MSFKVDYDKFYKDDPKACGEPFDEILSFIQNNKFDGAQALDLGCGQGRDAIPMSQMGIDVIAVDVSKVGINQLNKKIKSNKLSIETVLSDIVNFKTRKRFDFIIIDRVLHILPNFKERKIVLDRSISYLKKGGSLLIADTAKNILAIKKYISENHISLDLVYSTKSYIFYSKPFQK